MWAQYEDIVLKLTMKLAKSMINVRKTLTLSPMWTTHFIFRFPFMSTIHFKLLTYQYSCWIRNISQLPLLISSLQEESYEQNRCCFFSFFHLQFGIFEYYKPSSFKRSETCYRAMSFNLGFHALKRNTRRDSFAQIFYHTKTNTLNLQSCKGSWATCSLTILVLSSYVWGPTTKNTLTSQHF